MKRFITSVVAVVALSTLVMGQADAQLKIDKNRPIDPTAPVQRPPGTLDPLPKIDVLGLLTIESFGTDRQIARSLTAVIKSAATQPLEATFTFSRWNGKTWTTIGVSKTVTVPAKQKADVRTEFLQGADPQRLRLVVTNTVHKIHLVKELRLEAIKTTVFVVRYTTSLNWVLAGQYNNDLSDGFDASQLAKKLQSLGFQTRIIKKTITGLDTPFSTGTEIRTSLYARTTSTQTPSFDTKSKAVKFRDSLISLVKDRGLTVEDVREE